MPNSVRQLLHKNVLKTNLSDEQLQILSTIDSIDKVYLLLESSKDTDINHLLAAYAVEKAFLHPEINIAIVCGAWNQSKSVLAYVENFAPSFNNISRDIDRWQVKIGGSEIIAMPVDDGSRIRGKRANIIIMPNFLSIEQDILENILAGFACGHAKSINKVILTESDVDIELYDRYMPHRKQAILDDVFIKIWGRG